MDNPDRRADTESMMVRITCECCMSALFLIKNLVKRGMFKPNKVDILQKKKNEFVSFF